MYKNIKIFIVLKINIFFHSSFLELFFQIIKQRAESRGKNVLRPGPRFCGAQEKIIIYFANDPVDPPSARHSAYGVIVGPERSFIRDWTELPYSAPGHGVRPKTRARSGGRRSVARGSRISHVRKRNADDGIRNVRISAAAGSGYWPFSSIFNSNRRRHCPVGRRFGNVK